MYVRPRPRFRPRNAGTGFQPSLALNFLSGLLDSSITFSRGTQATQYTSNGTLQYAPNNLLTYSNQADNAAWTKSNSFVQTNLLTFSDAAVANYVLITAPVVNITPIVGFTNSVYFPYTPAGNIVAYKAYTVTINTLYTISAYVQMDDNSAPVLSSSAFSGDLTVVVDSNPAPLNLTVTSVGSGVYRVSASYTTAAFSGTNIGVVKYNTQSAKGFKVTGLQLVQGSVPGNYQATTSAALPVLYSDYNGVVRARKLCEAATTSAHFAYAGNPGAGLYVLSEYFKAGERTRVALGNSFAGDYAVFDLSAGTVASAGSGTVSGGAIINLGNGWYRCSAICAPTGTWNPAVVTVATGTATSYTGDGSSGIYIADAQLEAGSTVQAYNDTTSAAYYGPRFDYDPTSLVRQNFVLYSQDFQNTAEAGFSRPWIIGAGPNTVTPNYGLAPDGTATANRIIFSASAYPGRSNAVSTPLVAGTAYTFSFYIKRISGSNAGRIECSGALSGNATFTATSDWQRITFTATASTSTTATVYIYPEYAASSTGEYLVWGAQLNTGSTALTYTATTTAPYTLCAARGLLIEELRANLLLQSNDFQTSWLPTNITRTLASTTGPDGTLSGVKIEATAAAGTTLFQSAVVASTSATGSVYVKQGTGATTANSFILRNNTTATNLVGGTLNYGTGVFTYTIGSTGVVVTNIGNGWWRIAITATAGITSGDTLLWYVGWGGAVATAGDFLYAYGAQLEAGAFATSYIPTVASQVTRSADSASVNTLTPWFNAAEGTIFLEYVATADPAGTYRTQVKIVDGGGTNYLQLRNQNPSATTAITNNQVVAASVTQADMTSASLLASAVIKTTLAYKVNDFAAATNGAAPITDALGSVPTGLTTMSFGGGAFAAGQTWYRNLSDYQTRLPNATLQGLTV